MNPLELRQLKDEAAHARGVYAAAVMNATADAAGSYTGADVRRWRTEAAERWDAWHPLLASLAGGVTTGEPT